MAFQEAKWERSSRTPTQPAGARASTQVLKLKELTRCAFTRFTTRRPAPPLLVVPAQNPRAPPDVPISLSQPSEVSSVSQSLKYEHEVKREETLQDRFPSIADRLQRACASLH